MERARFFAAQAKAAGVTSRDHFGHFLDGAIVIGRSVTFHLQKEYAHVPGFDVWWKEVEAKRLGNEPLCKFFVETRNFVLKEGPTGTRMVANVAVTEHVFMSESFDVHVVRGQPWYRRRISILWEDCSRWLLRLLRRWRQRRSEARRLASQRAQVTKGNTASSADLYFMEAQWSARPALDLLAEYLDHLERSVGATEAEYRLVS